MFAISMSNLVSMAFGHWERKQIQAALDLANRRLIETSRQAGMAEVATGILHNVGNVLNSVDVSCTLALDQVREPEVAMREQAERELHLTPARHVECVIRNREASPQDVLLSTEGFTVRGRPQILLVLQRVSAPLGLGLVEPTERTPLPVVPAV
jgi:hypothetical protein